MNEVTEYSTSSFVIQIHISYYIKNVVIKRIEYNERYQNTPLITFLIPKSEGYKLGKIFRKELNLTDKQWSEGREMFGYLKSEFKANGGKVIHDGN